MAKKEKTNGDVYDLVSEFFGFVKTQFEKNERRVDLLNRRYELINDDIRDMKQGQRDMEKDLQGIKEDITGIAGAIGELAEKDENFEGRLEKLEKVK